VITGSVEAALRGSPGTVILVNSFEFDLLSGGQFFARAPLSERLEQVAFSLIYSFDLFYKVH